MELSSYKADTAASENGKWFPILDAKVKLVSMASSRVRKHIRSKEREIAQYNRSGLGVPEHVMEESLINTMAEAVIVDWEGFTENGTSIPFTHENAKRILKEYPVIREAIAQILNDNKAFTLSDQSYVEDSSKN